MEFYKDRAVTILTSVAIKTDELTHGLNDRFDDITEPFKSLVAIAVPIGALMLLSSTVAGVLIGAVVVFRLYPTVADRFFPNAFVTTPVVTETVAEPVVEVVPDGDDDGGITIGDNKTAAK